MPEVNIFLRPGEAMFETGESLSAISKFDSVLEKNQSIYIIDMFVFILLLYYLGEQR